MRLVVQRVRRAAVTVDGEVTAAIGPGALIFIGVARGDTIFDAAFLARKVAQLRIFDDREGRLNASIDDAGGELLVVSQFTLYGDCRKGTRPSYVEAAPAGEAAALYQEFMGRLRQLGYVVRQGEFRKRMLVEIHNDGPVTLILESRGRTRP
ncbi:MAG TPA: D-tyrosyl-tRNA(Tyr) deacylase [Kiritimatiellae bacterium]|nr:D-tyrosyl-tRNA(Tyr) deacylase [Kiritimatiellia bacterium]